MSTTTLPAASDENGGCSKEKKAEEILDDLARQLVETRKAHLLQIQDVLARKQVEDKYM